MASFDRAALTSWKDKALKLKARAENLKEKGEEMVGHAVQTLEIGASSFGLGVVAGRYGKVDVLGMPVELASGVGAHVLAFAGVAGKYDEHLHNLADGALAVYATKMGAEVGVKMLQKSGGATTTTSGELPERRSVGASTWATGATHSQAELAALRALANS